MTRLWRWLALALVGLGAARGAEVPAAAVQVLGRDAWEGTPREVRGLPGTHRLAVALPADEAGPLKAKTGVLAPGQYRLRLTLRPSHVANEVAWSCSVTVRVDSVEGASFPGIHFARVHQPETREFVFLHRQEGPVKIELRAFADAGVFEHQRALSDLKTGGGPKLDDLAAGGTEKAADDEDAPVELEFVADPRRACYYVVDQAELDPVSLSGAITGLAVDKIRYDPGETLRGSVQLTDAGGHGGQGVIDLFLEDGVCTRAKVKELPVTLDRPEQRLEFEVPLPARELGYALVAAYRSADGRDRSERAEYFNIASNFYRVAIHGGFGGRSFVTQTNYAAIRKPFDACRESYANCMEMFAWAEEDMVEMSSETEYWFSGQTCYHLRKKGLQDFIRAAHERGVSVVTYGKFVMSGYLGWKTAYEYPLDHRSQYHFPVGMWEGVDVRVLDRFRNKEFVPYAFGPVPGADDVFDPWWQSFLPINPDNTPRMARIAAEEMVRSIEMFGWDAVRWDGHPRGGGQCGGSGDYDREAARKTQSLVRYFKDITNAKHPRFQHGYNYLFTQDKPDPSWAVEDFELDELCRGGGLLMNESIRNSAGRPFEWIAGNLQTEGDLARERGGLLLAISCDGVTERDELVEAILYSASGCRPMGQAAEVPWVNRYGTRYSRYTFDETLTRLAKPEGVLAAEPADTRLWWQPFVYETRAENGKAQLVVNLLNVPRTESPRTEGARQFSLKMSPGTDPVTLTLKLPPTHTATAAHFIEPLTLAVAPAPLRDGRVEVGPVAIWRVLVVDLDVKDGAPALAAQFGPPRTFGVPRPDAPAERKVPAVLDPSKSVVEVNKDMSALFPATNDPFREEPALAAMSMADRNAALLKRREAPENQPEAFIKGWWKGGSLPADLALKDKPPAVGDLTPARDGVLDVFYARGAMDYSLRLYEVFAGFDRVRVHEARIGGGRTSYGLDEGIPWREFPEYDVLVYADIPHGAIGPENSYALVDYVKAGGGVFLTGGEYAFGKGGYLWTVLDRELLPVTAVQTVDTRYRDEPLVFEPGPDFAELKASVDFGAKPAFWCWNQVALKDGAKVFLVAGNRPVLVGWTLGKGRVACLLTTHRGMSGEGATAWFDWKDWPALAAAVLKWVAPEAGTERAPAAGPDPAAAAKLREQLTGDAMEDVLKEGANEGLPGMETESAGGAPSAELAGPALAERVRVLRQLVRAPDAASSAALAEQLGAVANLPLDLRFAMLGAIGRAPPANLAAAGTSCIASRDPGVRGSGYQLLALSGDPGFRNVMLGGSGAFETRLLDRGRYLALALARYAGDDPELHKAGKRKLADWNAREQAIKRQYTGGAEFSLAAPEQPCLDSESLFARIAWLAYLSRAEPEPHAAQLAREWLLIGQYQDYCDRTESGLWQSLRNATPAQKAAVEIKVHEIRLFRQLWAELGEQVRPHVAAAYRRQPQAVAEGFARATFTLEAKRCMDFMGRIPAKESRATLESLKGAAQPDLARWAAARLGAP